MSDKWRASTPYNFSDTVVSYIYKEGEEVAQTRGDDITLEEGRAIANEIVDACNRVAQLEEAIEELRSSFESRMERAAALVDEGELNDYWRGNCDALRVCLAGLNALSRSEAPEKEG